METTIDNGEVAHGEQPLDSIFWTAHVVDNASMRDNKNIMGHILHYSPSS